MAPQAANQEPIRILVVEDEGIIAEEIEDRLTGFGYQVVTIADSGPKAIAAAERFHPELVLMDIRIKGRMDGIVAAGEIQKVVSTAVVFLTAHSDAATLERSKQAAAYGYLLKPFDERGLFAAVQTAITRFRLERRLKESEQKYATTLASIGDAVITLDLAGRVTYMNPVAEALTQRTTAEANGLEMEDVFPIALEISHQLIDNPARKALRTGGTVWLDEPSMLVRLDRERIPIDGLAAPIFNAAGEVCGAVAAFRDIRQRRFTEKALRQTEEQLLQAQKMEAVGLLAGGIAHDFNNLIMIINGYAEVLLDSDGEKESTKPFLLEIKKAGERAASLTKQLMAFGRKQTLQLKILDVNALVVDIESLLRRIIREDIVLTTNLDSGLWAVKLDRCQIEQVIMNLAVNASDAMPDGGQLVIETANVELSGDQVKARAEMRAGNFVKLAICDTGTGIDPANRSRLFEPFFTTKETGKGTGLGLSTAYGIVKQSGGFIEVDSEIGRGSTFTVYLPTVEGSLPLPSAQECVPEQILRGTETVLVVEDDDNVRNVTSYALRQYGYTVITASSGAEAVSVLNEGASMPIQLMVTDIIMPGMGGSEVARRVTALRPDIRVLYLSGYNNDELLHLDMLRGDCHFLQKPCTIQALARKVRDVLDQ